MTESSESERDRNRKLIQIKSIKIFHPKDGVGTLAQFDAVIPGLLTIKGLKLVRDANTKVRTNSPWLRGNEECCSVAFQSWLRSAINRAAIDVVRDKFEGYFHWLKEDAGRPALMAPSRLCVRSWRES